MALRFVMKINWGEVAGWSETLYSTVSYAPSTPAAYVLARAWGILRASCLTRNATVAAVVISDPRAPRISTVASVNFPGVLGNATLPAGGADAPFVALQMNLQTDGRSRRQYLMRGLPDNDVVGGIVTFAGSTITPFNGYGNFLVGTSSSWALWNRDDSPPRGVTSVTGGGIVTMAADGGPVPIRNNPLYLSTRVAGGGAKVRQVTTVVGVNVDGTIRVRPWTNGDCDTGHLNILSYDADDITSFGFNSPNRAKSRKTGKPFFLSRGKASPSH